MDRETAGSLNAVSRCASARQGYFGVSSDKAVVPPARSVKCRDIARRAFTSKGEYMKGRFHLDRAVATTLGAMAIVGFSVQKSAATDYYWSGDGTNVGGAGDWSTPTSANLPHFGTSASGPFTTVWPNSNTTPDNAIFNAPASTAVTLDATTS